MGGGGTLNDNYLFIFQWGRVGINFGENVCLWLCSDLGHWCENRFLMRLNYSCLSADNSRKDKFSRWRDRGDGSKWRSFPQWHPRDRDGRGEICRCFNKHTVCQRGCRTRPLSDSFTAATSNYSRTVAQNPGRKLIGLYIIYNDNDDDDDVDND